MYKQDLYNRFKVLQRIGMTKWENKFVNEDIDLHVFLTLDDEDLKKIG